MLSPRSEPSSTQSCAATLASKDFLKDLMIEGVDDAKHQTCDDAYAQAIEGHKNYKTDKPSEHPCDQRLKTLINRQWRPGVGNRFLYT